MRDISFLEWFLLGMPVEWFVLTLVSGVVFVAWTVVSGGWARWRRARDERRDGRHQGD